MKKNIGIFLAFSTEQSKNHGISRLLSFILAGIIENNETQVFIATPTWFEKDTLEFLQDQPIDFSKIKILTTSRIPFYSHIVQFLLQKKLCGKKSFRIKNRDDQKKLFFINKYLLNVILFFLSFFSFLFIYPATKLYQVIKKSIETLDCKLRNFLTEYQFSKLFLMPLAQRGYRWSKKIINIAYKKAHRLVTSQKILRVLFSPIATLRHSFFVRATYTELRTRELNRLINVINSRSDIAVWYIPALFWPEIRHIKAKKIIAVPDIVALDFPQYFSDRAAIQTTQRMIESLPAGDHFICYSEHVKQKHLIEPFRVEAERISVIPHAHIDLSHWLDQSSTNKITISSRDTAIDILRNYQKQVLNNHVYLANYNIADMRFIFYSSQIRPYKNLHHLIRAYEILLRERFVNIKLVLTGDIKSDPDLYKTILDKRLQFDVLSFHDVTPNVLAALNHLAVCAVNPSLFEGGFPFTFTEAFSVGTPSVMSAIPPVLANIGDENLRAKMLFDPHDISDMVNKIEWAIQHGAQLFEWQKPLYESFKQRDWSSVAREYTHLFTHFSKPDYAHT